MIQLEHIFEKLDESKGQTELSQFEIGNVFEKCIDVKHCASGQRTINSKFTAKNIG